MSVQEHEVLQLPKVGACLRNVLQATRGQTSKVYEVDTHVEDDGSSLIGGVRLREP